jgi:molybdopterin synthase catalytic subunit
MSQPPFSIRFSAEPIIPAPPAFPTDGKCGAFLEFYGVVRGQEGDTSIAGLKYEAYQEMAEHQFKIILEELAKKYVVASVSILHRVGLVKTGEPSLHVRIESKHRQEGLSFMRELIDRMKQDVPIWKEPVT